MLGIRNIIKGMLLFFIQSKTGLFHHHASHIPKKKNIDFSRNLHNCITNREKNKKKKMPAGQLVRNIIYDWIFSSKIVDTEGILSKRIYGMCRTGFWDIYMKKRLNRQGRHLGPLLLAWHPAGIPVVKIQKDVIRLIIHTIIMYFRDKNRLK